MLENYDEFENKSPKNGYPGGKTRTMQDKLDRTDLPVVDDVDMEPYFELVAEIDSLTADIRETYAAIDQVVYALYDVSDEEIERVEETNGVGLELE